MIDPLNINLILIESSMCFVIQRDRTRHNCNVSLRSSALKATQVCYWLLKCDKTSNTSTTVLSANVARSYLFGI